MEFIYLLGGGTPTIKKYKADAAIVAGTLVLQAASADAGIVPSTTTSWVNSAGLAMDAGVLAVGAPVTYSTTQGDPEYIVSTLINPNAVLRVLMVSSATNAQLEGRVVGTASANGLTAVGTTGETDPSNPDMVNGTVWYTGGGQGGVSRRIVSTTTTLTVTVQVPFAANRIGDTFCTVPYSPCLSGTAGAILTMSTNLLNVRAELAPTGATATVVDIETNGRSNSYIHVLPMDSIFAGQLT